MPQKKPRSLKRLLLLLLSGLMAVFALVFLFIFFVATPHMLQQAEHAYMADQMQAVKGLLEVKLQDADMMADDIGIWDATVRFVQGEYPDYIEENWASSLLASYNFSFVVIQDRQGADCYVESRDYVNDGPYTLPQGFTRQLAAIGQALYNRYDSGDVPPPDSPIQAYGISGILYDEALAPVPFYVSAMPVMPQRDGASPSGVVFFGNLLDESYFHWLTNMQGNHFYWGAPRAQAEADEIYVWANGNETVGMVLQLQGLNGEALQLVMEDDRNIYQNGERALTSGGILLIVALAVLGVTLFLVIRNTVLRPMQRLGHDMADIGTDGQRLESDYSASAEFGSLASSINNMLQRLDESNISMQAFLSILNGLDAYLYVIDPATDEVLYINDKMRSRYDTEGTVVGRPCWQVLQCGLEARCATCRTRALNETTPVVAWESKNTISGRYYNNTATCIEWGRNRQAVLLHCLDVTDDLLTQHKLARRLQQQELMTSLSQTFISAEDIGTLILRALKMVGEFSGVSKTAVARFDPDAYTMEFDYLWYNADQSAPLMQVTSFPLERGEAMYEAFFQRSLDHLALDDIAGLPEYEGMRNSGVRAFMGAPIYNGDEFWGVLFFDECRTTTTWSESDIQLLKLIASVMTGAVTRSGIQKRLLMMSSIVSATPQSVSFIDISGNFKYINPGMERMVGYTAGELLAGGIAQLLDAEEYQKMSHQYIPTVLARGSLQLELEVICKNQKRILLSVSAFTAGQEMPGIGLIGTDITAQRRMEKDLIAAKEQAEQSSYAKSDFLSRMSHEMRTPMNAIIGMTNIARGTNDTERKEYCLDKIDEASKHLLGVINDILDMSKIEAGKFELSYTEFEFEKMLQRVTGVMQFRVEEKQQTLSVRLAADVPRVVVGDEQRLAQVLTNLLANAVKFTPEGGKVALAVRAQGMHEGLLSLEITVKDTGIGISPQQQAKLFNAFEQADGGVARKFGGTGLGLAISKNIVELMGGTITVSSKLGEGATFTCTVRVATGAPQLRQNGQMDWQAMRLLAVDDAPEVRQYFESLAAQYHFSCTVAQSGEEACRLLEAATQPYDFIFVDYRLPKMDGLALVRHIRSTYGDGSVIIVITSSDGDEVEPLAQAAGADGFVQKPLFPSLFIDCVNNYRRPTADKQEKAGQPQQEACFEGVNVLLAEDIAVNREIVQAILEDTGLVLHLAEDGGQALEMFEEKPDLYDLVLMDIHMPEMDGFEATRRIRALPMEKAKQVPIVAMTANVFKEDIDKCLAAGMDDHIGKPVDPDELLVKLKKYLNR